MHSDLQALLDDMAASERQARELLDGLTKAQANAQPLGPRTWSISQCLDHLARSNVLYAEAISHAVREAALSAPPRTGPIQPGWFVRFFIRNLEPPPRRKFAAPAKLMPPSGGSASDTLAAFLASHEGVRLLIGERCDLNLNRIRFRNPINRLMPFTVGGGLLLMMAHDRRHLWQARQVRKRLEGG